jgi:hypothetical protein
MARQIRPKYQVFVSSTYADLREARERVTWELLKSNYIPVGMEAFSATTDRGWETITRSIDESDYYVVLVGWLYGSVDEESGKSWTEREYEYARSKEMPVLAFLRVRSATPGDQVDTDAQSAKLVQEFREKLKSAHLCEAWTTEDDVRARVGAAVTKEMIRSETDGTSPPGWYRGDRILQSLSMAEELSRLSTDNRQLREQLASTARFRMPVDTLKNVPQGAVVKIKMPLLSGGLMNSEAHYEGFDADKNAIRFKTMNGASTFSYPLSHLQAVYDNPPHWHLVFGIFQ